MQAFFTILVFLLGVGLIGINSSKQIDVAVEGLVSHEIPAVIYSKDMDIMMDRSVAILYDHVTTASHERMRQKEDELDVTMTNLNHLLNNYGQYLQGEDQARVYQLMRLEMEKWNDFIADVLAYSRENQNDEAIALLVEGDELRNEFAGLIDQAGNLNLTAMKDGVTNIDDTYLAGRNVSSVVIIVAFLLGSTIAFFIAQSISRPIALVTQSLEKVADGDLTIDQVTVKNKDEIGILATALNKMVASLSNTIQSVNDSAIQVASSSEQLTASAQQSSSATEQMAKIAQTTAEGTDKQMQSIQEVTTSVQELSASLTQVAKNSDAMLKSSEDASQATDSGAKAVDIVDEQMKQINNSFTDIAVIIQNLGEKSKEIGQITALITDISNQTNLLALNAAI